MSMFSGMFQDVRSTDSGVEFSFEDIRFNLTNGQLEMDAAFEEMDRYFNAYDRLQEVVASIESYDGRLDTAVKEFVNSNNELAEALGISLEADEQQNGNAVQNAPEKKNIFVRAWDAIVRFFKFIGKKIADFFRWIFNGFKKLDDKVKAAEKSWSTLTPEEKKQFLDTATVDVSTELVNERAKAFIVLQKHLGNFNGKDLKTIMLMYYRDPKQIYPAEVAAALKVYGGVIKSNTGKLMEEVITESSSDFVGMTFKADWTNRKQSEVKTFRENGWSESFVDKYFGHCKDVSNACNDMDAIVKTFEQASAKASDKDCQDILEAIKKESSFSSYFKLNQVSVGDISHARGELKNKDVDAFRKGITSILQVFRMIATAAKEMYVKDNVILEHFKNPQKKHEKK